MIELGAAYKKKYLMFNLAFLTVICLVCVFAKVRATGSDPMGSLLVSQAIVQHGTVRLDAYENHLKNYTYRIQKKNSHYYYYFPLGASLFSVPIVAIANALGFDMTTHEAITQAPIFLALSLAIYWLSVKIACFYLDPLESSCVAIVYWLGSAYASVGATALWSHNFSVFFRWLLFICYLELSLSEILVNPF